MRKYLNLKCNKCQQKGTIAIDESIEVPEQLKPGDCQEEGIVIFYNIKLIDGNFNIIHKNPHLEEFEVVCKFCNSKDIEIK
ncbi:MAG: hypothetical protein ACPLSJ_04090 [Thermosulfidibacteraceae bacterium]|jgi:Zn finger protein HypA/HybF involved in hydrogenase expression